MSIYITRMKLPIAKKYYPESVDVEGWRGAHQPWALVPTSPGKLTTFIGIAPNLQQMSAIPCSFIQVTGPPSPALQTSLQTSWWVQLVTGQAGLQARTTCRLLGHTG